MPKSPTTNYQLPTTAKPHVAIATDWIYGGGSEKVVQQLHQLYPEAPIYTSYCTDEWRKKLDNKVVTGYLQHQPFRKLYKFLPLLRQWWFSSLDLKNFDLVISVTGNGEAKFVLSKWKMRNKSLNGKLANEKSDRKKPIHICYCNTPVHFYWRKYNEYLKNPGFKPKWLAKLGLSLLVKPLRSRDYKAAQRVDYFIANSSHITKDIKKYYNRDSVAIFPPVDTARFAQVQSSKLKVERSGFVTVGRQVPYKRIDLIIKACKELKLPLSVIGKGPEHKKLVDMTGSTIHFKTGIDNEELVSELASAEGFIFAAHEDFGIAPVEAMAAGTPVIAYKAGGALDYVIPGKTGEFFDKQTVESLKQTLQKFDSKKYNAAKIHAEAEKFSSENFRKQMKEFINTLTKA